MRKEQLTNGQSSINTSYNSDFLNSTLIQDNIDSNMGQFRNKIQQLNIMYMAVCKEQQMLAKQHSFFNTAVQDAKKQLYHLITANFTPISNQVRLEKCLKPGSINKINKKYLKVDDTQQSTNHAYKVIHTSGMNTPRNFPQQPCGSFRQPRSQKFDSQDSLLNFASQKLFAARSPQRILQNVECNSNGPDFDIQKCSKNSSKIKSIKTMDFQNNKVMGLGQKKSYLRSPRVNSDVMNFYQR